MCLEEREFFFKFEPTGVGDQQFVRHISCDKCGITYSPDSREEADKLLKIAVVINMMKSGEISDGTAVDQIDEIDSKVINDLLSSAEMWVCPKCDELNYSSISECWKCQTENPEFTEFLSEIDEEVEAEPED